MIRYLNLKRISFSLTRKLLYSTNQSDVVSKQNEPKNNELSKRNRPIKNEPFIKNLFAGKYEKEYLIFPELNSKELKELDSFIKPIESFYQESAKSFDRQENFQENFNKLKEFKFYSISAPEEFGK
jgi:acyl-CoA dehydrogenase family protein 9